MSQSNSKKATSTRDVKRARFAAEKKPRGASPVVLIVGLLVVVALVGGAIFALTRSSAAGNQAAAAAPSSALPGNPTGNQGLLVQAATLGHDPYPAVTAENNAIRFPLSTFDDNKAHFYTYMHQGKPIEFFVLKSSDGVVRAAFNACDVCFPAKKGYHQEGDEMVCNNCGSRFPSNKINEVKGGCNPSPLTRTVDGDTLVIQVSDLVAGLSYFEG
jgi:hypothetical protein